MSTASAWTSDDTNEAVTIVRTYHPDHHVTIEVSDGIATAIVTIPTGDLLDVLRGVGLTEIDGDTVEKVYRRAT